MTQYTSAGLTRLYQAVQQQAEDEFMAAIHRKQPDMTAEDEMHWRNYYRNLQARAEAQMCAEYEQSRGKR